MKIITVDIKLYFGDPNNDADIKTNNVPKTMILESLNVLVKGLASQIVEENKNIFRGDAEKVMDAVIEIDREKLNKMLGN